MGEAILSGWLNADEGLSGRSFTVIEHSQERCSQLREKYNVTAFSSFEEARNAYETPPEHFNGTREEYAETYPMADLFDIFVIAVKPQVIQEVLEDLGSAYRLSKKKPLVVSIAAGITTSQIAQALPEGAHIVRVMPNTPLQVGAGATVVAAGPGATRADVGQIRDMFAELGMAEIVDESQIDAVCALSGGGPAYTALMIEALTKAGTAQGLTPELSEKLALKTVYGTCKLIEETGVTPEQARIAVCSPGGTTLAALAAMEGEDAMLAGVPVGFSASIEAGIAAAVARAKELASC